MEKFPDHSSDLEDYEEEDCGTFFLQPSSSPYNITEKVQQANIELCNSALKNDKTIKVTFKEEITTFQDELTDDDVNSIESDECLQSPQILQYKTINEQYEIEKKFNIFEAIDEDDEIVEELFAGDVIEDENECSINNSSENIQENDNNNFKDLVINLNQEEENKTPSIISNTSSTKKLSSKKIKKKPQIPQLDEVICKNHCLEKVDDLSLSVKKLKIKEKPIDCPLLKLRQRKCCDLNKIRNPQNLPTYNGLRSEYGLSLNELKRREKQKQLLKIKEQKRQQLLEEYHYRKIQQNEQVFCQWLKDVARRNKIGPQKTVSTTINKEKNANYKQSPNPSVVNFRLRDSRTERPNTAKEFIPKHNIKRAKRPHTSPCVFIQIPPKLLEKGITIGDLLVTNNDKINKLNILTL